MLAKRWMWLSPTLMTARQRSGSSARSRLPSLLSWRSLLAIAEMLVPLLAWGLIYLSAGSQYLIMADNPALNFTALRFAMYSWRCLSTSSLCCWRAGNLERSYSGTTPPSLASQNLMMRWHRLPRFLSRSLLLASMNSL